MSDRTDPERNPATWMVRPTAQRACGHCGASFVPRWPSTRYCSPACRREVEAARVHRRKRPAPGEGP